MYLKFAVSERVVRAGKVHLHAPEDFAQLSLLPRPGSDLLGGAAQGKDDHSLLHVGHFHRELESDAFRGDLRDGQVVMQVPSRI